MIWTLFVHWSIKSIGSLYRVLYFYVLCTFSVASGETGDSWTRRPQITTEPQRNQYTRYPLLIDPLVHGKLLIIASFTFRQTIRVSVSPCIFLRVRGLSLFFAVNHHYASTLPGHYQHATSPPSTIVNHYGGASPNKSPNIGRSSSAENMSPQHTKVRTL